MENPAYWRYGKPIGKKQKKKRDNIAATVSPGIHLTWGAARPAAATEAVMQADIIV